MRLLLLLLCLVVALVCSHDDVWRVSLVHRDVYTTHRLVQHTTAPLSMCHTSFPLPFPSFAFVGICPAPSVCPKEFEHAHLRGVRSSSCVFRPSLSSCVLVFPPLPVPVLLARPPSVESLSHAYLCFALYYFPPLFPLSLCFFLCRMCELAGFRSESTLNIVHYFAYTCHAPQRQHAAASNMTRTVPVCCARSLPAARLPLC